MKLHCGEYLIRSLMEIIGKLYSLAILCRVRSVAIEPSLGSMMVDRIDTGLNPARVTKSTDASVWPALFSTPPFLFLRGKTWPGLLKSSGLESGEARARIVVALSAADTPLDVVLAS